jgi:hypothetical protein
VLILIAASVIFALLLSNVLYDLFEVAIPLDHVDAGEISGPQA